MDIHSIISEQIGVVCFITNIVKCVLEEWHNPRGSQPEHRANTQRGRHMYRHSYTAAATATSFSCTVVVFQAFKQRVFTFCFIKNSDSWIAVEAQHSYCTGGPAHRSQG